MFRSYAWFCVLLFLETALNVQATDIKDPVLYYGNLPELNDVYYEKCAPEIICDPTAVYRTDNSSCNNLAHPSWGASITPFIRLANAVFDDNVNKIRQKQKDGTKLPTPRDIQLALFLYRSRECPDNFYNDHLNQLGQWLTHDITALPPITTGSTNCCAEKSPDTIPQCQTIIELSADDPVYGKTGQTCMNNNRVVTSDSFGCDITPRIGMNQATSFFDASQLYGHTPDMPPQLRTFVGGKLKTDIINGYEFCPQQQRNGSLVCNGRDDVHICFLAGDIRVNQHFGITAYQTMFTRFHNILTDELHHLNPVWPDEVLYQETRKIIGAINQILAYRDYIPVLIGKEYTEMVGLALNEFERTIYNPLLMPQLTIEFSAGVFRIQHNITPSKYNFINTKNQLFNSVYLNEWMFKPDPLVIPSVFDGLVKGMIQSPKREPVHSYNYAISNFMFANSLPGTGNTDLLTVDIERGRECGIATYNTAREICGFPRATTFMELTDILSISDAMQLKNVYSSPDDVDLIVGALLEPPCPGAMVGPISKCIMADVFYRLRYSDCYFYDVQGQPGSFSDKQLEALRKIDLGIIFCATTGLKEVPIDIFALLPSGTQSCEERLLNLDLSAWKVTP